MEALLTFSDNNITILKFNGVKEFYSSVNKKQQMKNITHLHAALVLSSKCPEDDELFLFPYGIKSCKRWYTNSFKHIFFLTKEEQRICSNFLSVCQLQS